MNVTWPAYSHIILLMADGANLYGICSLYKAYTVRVQLTAHLPAFFPLDGLICGPAKNTAYIVLYWTWRSKKLPASHKSIGRWPEPDLLAVLTYALQSLLFPSCEKNQAT